MTKLNSPTAYSVSMKLCSFLRSKGLAVSYTGEIGLDGDKVPSVDKMNVDLIVVVGGDGTVLRTAQLSGSTPIFGVNVGALGFLCEVAPDAALGALERVLDGRFYMDYRAKLSITYKDLAFPDILNEVLVATSKPSRILSLAVSKNGEPIYRGKADGIIISTTTGSTAYALSAGGSVIDPQVDILEAVFICPLSAGLRPLIFPCSSSIEIRVMPGAAPGIVVLDGQNVQDVEYDAPIVVRRSENQAAFARINPPRFYASIREKIKGLEI